MVVCFGWLRSILPPSYRNFADGANVFFMSSRRVWRIPRAWLVNTERETGIGRKDMFRMISIHSSLYDYLQATSSRTPVPGGGSGAALAGALGVSLALMAVRYSIRQPADEPPWAETLERLTVAGRLLQEGIAEDMERFGDFVEARRVSTDQEAGESPEGMRAIVRTPLRLAGVCLDALILLRECANRIRRPYLSDLGAGGLLLAAALRSALLTARANLGEWADREESWESLADLHRLERECAHRAEALEAAITARMSEGNG